MANLKIDNLRVRSASINKQLKEGRYDTEDISPLEKAYVLKHTPSPREPRTDLKRGNVVVILEGMYTARRAVFLQQLSDNMVVVFCISVGNTPLLFKIDGRYLFKLSASIEVPSNINVDAEKLHESKRGEAERVDVEPEEAEKAANQAILSSISKVKFMRSYLTEDFKIDHSVEFYSQDY